MNVILSFLSPIHTYRDKNEVFHVSLANYEDILSDNLKETHSTNESGLRYVLQKLGDEKLDAYIALASEKIRTGKVNGTTETNLEYFVARMDTVLDAYNYDCSVNDIFETIELNENSEKQDYIKAVTEAVHYVNEIRKVNGTYGPVDLYLDISGGMRDSSMLILLISRILENNEGINLKEVIYSNYNNDTKEGRVEVMTDVYKLLDLVSGINEFINFGSMKTLNTYFAQDEVKVNVGPELKELLDAMGDFTKMVQLCRSTVFDRAITLLHDKLIAYEEYYAKKDNPNITEKLFKGFLSFIHVKYARLFMEHNSSQEKYVHYMRWCHDNGYLQQCLTMISETFPQVCFGDNKPLLKFNSKETEAKYRDKFQDKSGKKDFFGWLIADYNYTAVDGNAQKIFDENLEAIWKKFKKDLSNNKVEPNYTEFNESVQTLISEFKSKPVERKSGKVKLIIDVQQAKKEIKRFVRDEVFTQLRKRKYSEESFREMLLDFNKKALNIGCIDIEKTLSNMTAFADYYLENPNRPVEELDMNLPVLRYVKEHQIIEKEGIQTLQWLLKILVAGSQPSVKNIEYDCLLDVPFVQHTSNAKSILSLIYDRELVSEIKDINNIILTFYELKEERNASNHANIGRNNSTSYDYLYAKINGFITRLEEVVL